MMVLEDPKQVPAPIDKIEEVLSTLPGHFQDCVRSNLDDLEEVRVIVGYPLTLKVGDDMLEFPGLDVDIKDVRYIRDKLNGFRSDGRAGVERTLHRYSAIKNSVEMITGVAIRLARALPGVAEPLREFLKGSGSLMLVGPPGTGKTSLLRDVVRIEGDLHGQRACAIDTSNEMGGDGDAPHPCLGRALRIHVGDPARQGEILRSTIANLTPEVIIVDEIGYHGDDVQQIETCSRRGVKVIATLHGRTLRDVLQNPAFWPLLGNPILKENRRLTDTVFEFALVLEGKGAWTLYPNLQDTVDALLRGDPPRGIRFVNGQTINTNISNQPVLKEVN